MNDSPGQFLEPIIIKVSDFTRTPGARYKSDGAFSGEEFRETQLDPLIDKKASRVPLIEIDFSGTLGYPTSFLEEAFGGLIREYPSLAQEFIIKIRLLPDPRRPHVHELAREYMEDALAQLLNQQR